MPAFDPEFDYLYAVTADGTVVHHPGGYVPSVESDDAHDVLIDGVPRREGEWSALVGYTGQHGYRGAIMHASELWSPVMLEELAGHADTPAPGARTLFAVVAVNSEHDDAECGCNGEECDVYESDRCVGWAVIYCVESTATAPEYLYTPADTIRPGDTLPDVSRFPVATVVTFPNEGVRVTFRGTSFTRHFPHGGPEFGFPAVRVERPAHR